MVTSAQAGLVPVSSEDDEDDQSASGTRGLGYSLRRARVLARCEAVATEMEAEVQVRVVIEAGHMYRMNFWSPFTSQFRCWGAEWHTVPV
jgi:hypothetical protein